MYIYILSIKYNKAIGEAIGGTFFIGPIILSDRKLYLYFYLYDIQCRIF